MSSRSQVEDRQSAPTGIPRLVRLLSERYGPFPDEPRLEPAHEVVFTILSQHTSDTNSARAFGLLMEKFGTLEEVARADVAEIEEAITPGGLARVKAPRIKEVLNLVLELNGSLDLSFLSEMPLEEAKTWLRQLPGIGPKSAGIILNFSLGMPAMAIDTHIYRVCQRLALIGPKVTADKAHGILEAAVAPEQVFEFHVSFITHGRQVCKAQRPQCQECVVASECPAREQFMAEDRDAALEPGEISAKTTGKANKKARAKAIKVKKLPHSPAAE